jgi:crotonobetainyl-CoA:carnitine CoA-transferase CaiB-like acyl-CoA transferase
MSLPLTGVRVLDLTRVVSGPFCSMILGDLGAEVIKIEPPGKGDPVRQQGAIKNGLSWFFASFNRNKKSVTLNLRSAEGREIFSKLIAHSDVIVENFRPGVMESMGFGDEALKTINPNLIHGSVTGFGTTGPYRDRPAFDFIAQAITGFMSLNGDADGPPQRVGPPISDLTSGLYAALGVVAAIARRERTGEGGSATVSLTGALTSLLGFHAAGFLATGELPERTGNFHGIVSPYGIFRTKDSEIAIAPGNDAIYDRLLEALGAQELRDHPDFKTNDLRLRNRAAIFAEIEKRTRNETSEYWIEALNDAGVPCGPVNNLRDALVDDPQSKDQKTVVTVEHPGFGDVSMLSSPLLFEGVKLPVNLPAPRLGEHTDEILDRIGIQRDVADELRKKGVL